MFLMVLCEGVNAATLTWTGSTDNLASTPNNWSGVVPLRAPVDGDSVIFDSGDIDCEWDLTVTLVSFTTWGYTGKIIQRPDKILTIAKVFIWTGAASNSAADRDNWSRGELPQTGDAVIFNETSAENYNNCTWDIDVSPFDFGMRSSYTGTVTEANGLAIPGNLRVDGGTLDLNDKDLDVDGDLSIGTNGTIDATSSTITVAGDWKNEGTFDAGTSSVILNGADQTFYSNATFHDLEKTDGTLNLNYKDLDVDGDLSIGTNGTINATSSTITVAGDWKNEGTFDADTSKVVLDGTNQTVYGNTTFHHLEKTVDYAYTLRFEEGSIQKITFFISLRSTGTPENQLQIRSTVDDSPYYICAPKSANNYIWNSNVRDMRGFHPSECPEEESEIRAVYGTDSGGNDGIDFIGEGQGGTCQ
jgi:hypothetical protein